MSEEWESIPDFPDYSVSNYGRVKRLTAAKGTWPGRILGDRFDSSGYMMVSIPDSKGIYRGLKVSRLVAQAFLPNPENKPEVNHQDGIKKNNHVSNLEWVTHPEQMSHAASTGLMHKGSRSGNAILTEKNIPVIRKLRQSGKSFQSIGDKFGASWSCIRDVVVGRTWSHV